MSDKHRGGYALPDVRPFSWQHELHANDIDGYTDVWVIYFDPPNSEELHTIARCFDQAYAQRICELLNVHGGLTDGE